MSDILNIDFTYSGKVCKLYILRWLKISESTKTFTQNAGNTISGIQNFIIFFAPVSYLVYVSMLPAYCELPSFIFVSSLTSVIIQ